MRPMSQEELDELKRQIGTPKPIVWPPQLGDEDMPTMRQMVKDLELDPGEDSDDEEDYGE